MFSQVFAENRDGNGSVLNYLQELHITSNCSFRKSNKKCKKKTDKINSQLLSTRTHTTYWPSSIAVDDVIRGYPTLPFAL